MSVVFPESWSKFFDAKTQELFLNTVEMCEKDAQQNNTRMLPNKEDLLRMLEYTPCDKVKVVILCLETYHTMTRDSLGKEIPKGTGLAYSLNPEDRDIPVVLRNIYGAIKHDIPEFVIPQHGDLRGWCDQGVLLLNCSLTTRRGSPRKHIEFWKPFTRRLLEFLGKEKPRCIYLLWGNEVSDYEKYISARNNRIMTSSHPISRTGNFLTCGHFAEVDNRLLEDTQADCQRIDWQI